MSELEEKQKSEIKFVLVYYGSVGKSVYPLGLSKLAARLSHGLVFKYGQCERRTSGFGSTLALCGSQVISLVYKMKKKRVTFKTSCGLHEAKCSSTIISVKSNDWLGLCCKGFSSCSDTDHRLGEKKRHVLSLNLCLYSRNPYFITYSLTGLII